MNKVWLIIKREYITRVRKKSFIIMTILGPILFAGIAILPAWLATRDGDEKVIEVVDESGLFGGKLSNTSNLNFVFVDQKLEEVKSQMQDNENHAVLYIPKLDLDNPMGVTLFTPGSPSLEIVSSIERNLKREIEDIKLKALGIDAQTLESINTKLNIQTIKLTVAGEEKGSATAATITGYLSSFLIYFFIFYYGAQVMRGVMDEKTNRIVEVIISSVKPFQLMMGKILGIAGVGLTQFLLWLILTLTISSTVFWLIGMNDIQSLTVDPGLQQEAPNPKFQELLSSFDTINVPLVAFSFLFFFLGAYLLYAALFAMVGSAVDSEADTQQFMLPIVIPLLFAIIVLSAVIKEPHGDLAFWTSMIPFTSPVVMMMRIPFSVPIWQLILSMLLLVMGFILTTWLAGRVYRIGILVHGTKVNYKTLARWLFMKN